MRHLYFVGFCVGKIYFELCKMHLISDTTSNEKVIALSVRLCFACVHLLIIKLYHFHSLSAALLERAHLSRGSEIKSNNPSKTVAYKEY